ncbi:hypothetical protein LIER_11445 [Lithospermum erythrorhizon]|uniref:Uncharacterized protein n=1 Tax=Lithospermum erythrorhizon TaxID=34254 RepID=A0AAV3PPZ4_LITER
MLLVADTVYNHIPMKENILSPLTAAEVFYITKYNKSICIDALRQSGDKAALDNILSSQSHSTIRTESWIRDDVLLTNFIFIFLTRILFEFDCSIQ